MVVFGVNLVHGNSFCGNIQNMFSCKESLREREDMTAFILDYTRKELHCQDKWDTFLMSMLACTL